MTYLAYHTCITHEVAAALMALTFSEFTALHHLAWLCSQQAGVPGNQILPEQPSTNVEGELVYQHCSYLALQEGSSRERLLHCLQAYPARSLFSAHSGPVLEIILFIHYLSYPVFLLPSSSPDPIISISWDHLLNNPFVNESLSQGLLLEGPSQ